MRIPKPWQRKQTGCWYVQMDGRQISLGRDKDEAFKKYHRLMGGVEKAPEKLTARDLLGHYWEWLQKNRAASTAANRKNLLISFGESLPANLKASDLRPHHIEKWMGPDLGPTTRNDRITLVKAIWNWAVQMGYLDSNPIEKMPKPPRNVRQDYLREDEWKKVLENLTDQEFREFVAVMLLTGARPQEMFKLEAKHLEGNRLVLPRAESKGKKRSRVIYLPDEALSVVSRLAEEHPEGRLFRNSNGEPWNKNSIGLRFRRLAKKLGIPGLCATVLRHSFAHHRLSSGQDALTVAKLMGHVDTRMLATRYGHLDSNEAYMNEAANQQASSTPLLSPSASNSGRVVDSCPSQPV